MCALGIVHHAYQRIQLKHNPTKSAFKSFIQEYVLARLYTEATEAHFFHRNQVQLTDFQLGSTES